MICSPYNRVVMERNDDVDALVTLPREIRPSAFGKTYRGADLAIALAPRIGDFEIVGATRARVRVGYTYVTRKVARLTSRLYFNRFMISEADPELADRFPDRPVQHEVEQLLDLVAIGGARERVTRLRIDVTDADRAVVAAMPSGPLVVHIADRWFHEGSTLASTIALIRELRRFELPIVLTHGPESAAAVAEIESSQVADAVVGGLSFHQWAAAFERARCIVTVDTGATHVASAMRRPTVVVFEHRYFRLSSQEWAPYGVPHALVRKPADTSEASLAQLRAGIIANVDRLLHA